MSAGETLRTALLRDVSTVIPVGESVVSACVNHFELLLRWNQRLNLTKVTSPADAAVRHYGQSLFLAAHITAGRVVDVGSGAGFPGIPVALLRPECSVTLVESDQRKAVFLREAARGRSNIEVVAERAEGLQKRFDWMVARAVSPRDLLDLDLAPDCALLLAAEHARELGLWTKPLPWGGGVLASRSALGRVI